MGGATLGERPIQMLRRKSWGLVAMNRMVGRQKDRLKVRRASKAGGTSIDLKAELQILQEEHRDDGKFATGNHHHTFHNGDEYDGEWKDGSMHGLGTLQYHSGNLYSGEWRNNKRHGYGSFTNTNANTTYEGEWKDDKRAGKGRFVEEGNTYNGEWKNGVMAGHGVYDFQNGDRYDGAFADNDFNGKGTFAYPSGDKYEGEWVDGKQHGKGTFYYPELGHKYVGEWQKDKKHGHGKYHATDYEYDGEWRDDNMCGHGTFTYSTGDKYVGDWSDNLEEGHGCYYSADGSVYDGNWHQGQRNGTGLHTTPDGAKYEGEWVNNKKGGTGTYHYPHGDKYTGDWYEDQMHGEGMYIYKNGKKYKVEYRNGACVNKVLLSEPSAPALDKEGSSRQFSNQSFSSPSPTSMSPKPPSNIKADTYTRNQLPSPAPITPKTQDSRGADEIRATELLDAARTSIIAITAALDTPAQADPLVADEGRDVVSRLGPLLSKPIPETLREELVEVNNQLVELLRLWDEFQAAEDEHDKDEAARRAQELEDAARDAQEADRRRKDREATQRKVEEIKMRKRVEQQKKAELDKLRNDMEDMKKGNEMGDLRKLEEELQKALGAKQAEASRLRAEVEATPNKEMELLRQQIQEETSKREDVERKREEVKFATEMEGVERTVQVLKDKFDAEIAKLQEEVDKHQAEANKYTREADECARQAEAALNGEGLDEDGLTAKRLNEEIQHVKLQLDMVNNKNKVWSAAEITSEVNRLQKLYEKEMQERKKLYNALVDLKGNIRVYCRVRPMSDADKQYRGGTEAVEFPNDETIILTAPKRFEYVFDRVFPPGTSQERVFADTLPVITSVVDGYNVTIFAYGQTGSGKTFTMTGYPDHPGIMRRSLTELFRIIEQRRETEECEVKVSVLEIYNETIRDLQVGASRQKKYAVRSDPLQGQYVENLTQTPVTNPQDIDSILETSQKNRTEGKTNMNAHSSRSHMILYIVLYIENKQTHSKIVSKLSLIDLAGSERLDKSGATGQALLEAQHINKSLSALGDVIASLAHKSKHTPYRNSALTHLLQDSLGGKAKTLMFANCSPLTGDASESQSTLLFASRVRGVELGKATKNVDAA